MIPFDKIEKTEYIRYLRAAQYLLDRGYVLDTTLFELAETIYIREMKQKNADSNNN